MEKENIETEFAVEQKICKRPFKENILYRLRHCHQICPITMLQSLEFIAAMTLFKFQYKIRFSYMNIKNSCFKFGKLETINMNIEVFKTLAQFMNYYLVA